MSFYYRGIPRNVVTLTVTQVIQGLLQKRADPNRKTSKDEPKLGFPPWVSALDLAAFYKHNDAGLFSSS